MINPYFHLMISLSPSFCVNCLTLASLHFKIAEYNSVRTIRLTKVSVLQLWDRQNHGTPGVRQTSCITVVVDTIALDANGQLNKKSFRAAEIGATQHKENCENQVLCSCTQPKENNWIVDDVERNALPRRIMTEIIKKTSSTACGMQDKNLHHRCTSLPLNLSVTTNFFCLKPMDSSIVGSDRYGAIMVSTTADQWLERVRLEENTSSKVIKYVVRQPEQQNLSNRASSILMLKRTAIIGPMMNISRARNANQ